MIIFSAIGFWLAYAEHIALFEDYVPRSWKTVDSTRGVRYRLYRIMYSMNTTIKRFCFCKSRPSPPTDLFIAYLRFAFAACQVGWVTSTFRSCYITYGLY